MNARGVGHSCTDLARFSPYDAVLPFFTFLLPVSVNSKSIELTSRVTGVGQNKHSVPNVVGTNGRSRNAMPLRIIPDLGQRPENSVQSPSKQRCHVFQHNNFRSELLNHANGLEEESASGTVKSCPCAGVGNILTGESPADDVDSE